jgi:hypothetical protein
MTINIEINQDTTTTELLAIKALVNSFLIQMHVTDAAESHTRTHGISESMFTDDEIKETYDKIAATHHAMTVMELPGQTGHGVLSPAEIFKRDKDEEIIPETIELIDKTEHVTIDAYTSGKPLPPGVDVDATGLPWDHRIHSRTKSKTGDGKWRVKRGESEEIIQEVENELRGTMQNARAPLPPKPPATNLPPPPPGDVQTFPQFTAKATKLLTQKRITKSELTTMLDSFNIKALTLVANVPHLIPQLSKALDALVGA